MISLPTLCCSFDYPFCMKTSSVLLILGLTGLLGLGCKKPVEVETEPPLPPEGCRIVRTIYKSPVPFISQTPTAKIDPETVALEDGQRAQVALLSITTYKYDSQGRIIEILEKNAIDPKAYILNRFVYEVSRLITFSESSSSLILKPSSSNDTIPLNQQGLQNYYTPEGREAYTYNSNKQLVSRYIDRPDTHTYVNGNLVAAINYYPTWVKENGQWVPTDYQLREYKYNTSRPNLPVVRQYYGNTSKNLPIKEIWSMKGSSDFADGPVYQKVYLYSYDKLGRVKRQIAHGKSLNRGWIIEDDSYGVGVTDYIYECS